jgi:hypothetical protein
MPRRILWRAADAGSIRVPAGRTIGGQTTRNRNNGRGVSNRFDGIFSDLANYFRAAVCGKNSRSDPWIEEQGENQSSPRCSFSEQSEWINEFAFDQRLGIFTPTHYIFDLVDNFIEIMGDDSPTVEEIQNETTGEGTEN